MIIVMGMKSRLPIAIPKDNIGLIRRLNPLAASDYTRPFTRIYLKEPIDGVRFIDCGEEVALICKAKSED